MNKNRLTALLLASTFWLGGCTATVSESVESTEAPEVFSVDNIRAQDDFYGYINGSTLYNMDVNPVTGSAGSFEQCESIVQERMLTVVADVVSGDRSTYEDGSSRQIIYDAYYQILESQITMDSGSVVNLLATCDAINNAEDIDELLEMYSVITNEYGVLPYYNVSVEPNVFDSTENIPVFKFQGLGSVELSVIQRGNGGARALEEEIARALRSIGISEEEASSRAFNVICTEIDIASNTNYEIVDAVKRNPYAYPYSLMSVDELDSLLVNQGIEGFCHMSGISRSCLNNIGVYDIGHVVYLDSLLTEENLQVLKDMATFKLLEAYGAYIPFDGPDNSTVPTDMTVLSTLIRYFSEQLGELYAEYYLDEETIADVTNMTEAIINEYIELISASYMSDEGKSAVIGKLNSMELYIGSPAIHEVNPEDANLIGEDGLDTLIRSRKNTISEYISKLGNPVNHDEEGWMMPSYLVNACYNPYLNAINIPLGIMLPPFYDSNASEGANYGGLGVIIGHEISHAFDSDGMKFDYSGSYNLDWIPESDRNEFDERNQVFIEYFDSFTVNDVYHVNGETTLGENLADIGGMQCVLSIVDDDQKQALFENYALVWASVTPVYTAIEMLELDEHSPDRIRVNAVVALFDDFYSIYDVCEGDTMYVAPENRIVRW